MLVNFLISFLSILLFPLFLPKVHLIFFAPFLVLSYYKKSLYGSFWMSLLAGCALDIFSASNPFGISSLNYVLTTRCLYNQKRNFFEEKLTTLPLMTFLFSLLSTAIGATLLFFFARSIPFSIKSLLTDCLLMPVCDALYAFALFSLPFQILKKLKFKNSYEDA